MLTEILSDLSCIFDRIRNDACCGYSRLLKLIIYGEWIAECKCDKWIGLSRKEVIISRNSHVEVNKPDTYKRLQVTENILSSICRYFSRVTGWNGTSSTRCQKSRRSSPIGSFNKCKQATKTIWTLNTTQGQLRDSTAYSDGLLSVMRERSFHSSVTCYTKESSIATPSFESLDSDNLKPVRAVKPEKVAKRVGVTTIVKGKLEQYRKPEQKYYNLIKLIADPYFLVACYEEIAQKKGNMSPPLQLTLQNHRQQGSNGYTIDGLNWEWFVKTSESLKSGIFVFKPNRRVELPKTNGQTRPIGFNSPREKIVEKALHAVLEAIFESKFLSSSQRFSSKKSVHSALLRVYLLGHKHKWVIQGDITKCFDQIPHGIIMKRINKYVGDPRFLEILNKFLNAGYIDPNNGKVVLSHIGTPQAGILSPLLANIVLHELDKYMFKYESSFKKGLKRWINPEYKSLASKKSWATDHLKRRSLLNQRRYLRRSLIADPDFRRLEYIRYADDFVVFVSGSLKDAKFILSNIKDLLKTNCGLELNQEKTVIRNLSKEKWSFLGAEVKKLKHNPCCIWNEIKCSLLCACAIVRYRDSYSGARTSKATFACDYCWFSKIPTHASKGKRGSNCHWRVRHLRGEGVGVSKLMLNAPIIKLINELKKGGFIRQNKLGKYIPQAITSIINRNHYEIIAYYNSKIHGILNFYGFASNRFRLASVIWMLKASCALTLARKLKLRTMRKVFRKFGSNLKCPETEKELYRPSSLKVRHDF